MRKSTIVVSVALLCCAVAQAAQPPVGGKDIASKPDPQIERPGSTGPGQGELEMEKEFELAGISIPWGESGTVPSTRAEGTRDGLCRFPYRFAIRNTDHSASLATTSMITLAAVDGVVLHSAYLPVIAGGGRTVSNGTILLAPGRWVLYVKIDAAGRINELDESNNLRRVGITVLGDCGTSALRTRN